MSKRKKFENAISGPWCLLFENRYGHNPQINSNLYSVAKVHYDKNSGI
jgi:hypothetical protein